MRAKIDNEFKAQVPCRILKIKLIVTESRTVVSRGWSGGREEMWVRATNLQSQEE